MYVCGRREMGGRGREGRGESVGSVTPALPRCGRLEALCPEMALPLISLSQSLTTMSTSSQDPERQVIIPVYSHHAGPFDSEGNVVCYTHRLVAALRESKTDKNPDR